MATSSAEGERRNPLPSDATLLDSFDDPEWTLTSDEGSLSPTEDAPVDTRRALRVAPAPKSDAAAILRNLGTLQNWSACRSLSFWIRPEKDLPVRAIEPRFHDGTRYVAGIELTSHQKADALPANQWTQLRYDFGDTPRDTILMLRIYFNRGRLSSGSFDIDELLLHGGKPTKATAAKPGTDGVDRPGATPR